MTDRRTDRRQEPRAEQQCRCGRWTGREVPPEKAAAWRVHRLVEVP